MLSFLVVAAQDVFAQNPVANFTTNVTSGCAPLTVRFTDQSTGNPHTWNWEFSNGTLSSAQNPVITFSQPGTYSVRLVVQNNNGIAEVERINLITVYPSPAANFSANLTLACLPATIQFTDLSTTAEGVITNWAWDFGDGTVSFVQNPTHTYTSTGFYSVTLRVTSNTGCENIRTRTSYIRVVGNISTDFQFIPPTTCLPPYNTQFQNQSNGPGSISYTWNFGNSQTSTAVNPTTVYTAPGTYTVTLNAVSDLGCQGSTTKDITINSATTDFIVPTDICLGVPVSFQNNSNPPPITSDWTFGDGTSSGQVNPTKTYFTPGVYEVKLVNRYANCVDSITHTVNVESGPGVDFSANDSSFCSIPATVNFTDLTPNAVSWEWDFGDGTTSSQQNPAHTYNSFGSYTVTLIATTESGCRDTMRKANFIIVREPEITLNLPAGDCVPFQFQPMATIDSPDPIVTYQWDLGAPGGIFNVANPPPFTYTNPGTYNVSLTVTTASGCTKTVSVPGGIRTGVPPTVDFTAQPLDACASDTFVFTNNSVTTPGAEVVWNWAFGDGASSTEMNPTHVYVDTGYLAVILTVSNNRCISADTMYLQVRPPVAEFEYDVNCTNNQVTFIDNSLYDPALSPLTWFWEFGDPANTTYSGQNPPPMNYPGPGEYMVQLTVTNGSCTYQTSQLVRILNEVANFTVSKTNLCPDEVVTLTATPTDPNNIRWFAWEVNGVPLADSSLSVQYRPSVFGTYNVRLTISDINGCISTRLLNNAFTINGPEALFTVTRDGECSSRTFRFNDQSTSISPITNWRFNFGDGVVQNFTSPPFLHTYPETGVYNVRMTITDQGGCQSSYTLPTPLLVSTPRAGFRADTFYCPGAPINFVDTSSGTGLTYFWDFGDGSTSTESNPQHAYPDGDADYTVKLVITDINGCQDSAILPAYIKIRRPKAAFAIQDTTTICPPLRTSFTFMGADYQTLLWDFGDGGMSNQESPSHFYGSAGTFTPTLYLTGPGGCMDSAKSNVTVHNINDVRIEYGPDYRACNELNVDFNLTVPEGFKFILYFGDGTADSSRRTSLSHFYHKPSFNRPYIVLFDSISGCQNTVMGAQRIEVMGAIPLFGVDRFEFCDTGRVVFRDFTTRNEPITTTLWTFGDGATSNEQSPTHHFSAPGTYIVRLDITTESNCQSSYQDTILVYRTPEPIITGRDTICVNQEERYLGTLAVSDTLTNWNWNFGNGTVTTTQDGVATYRAAGDYTIRLITSNKLGCSDTTFQDIHVTPAPSAIPVQNPITIISGASTPLEMIYDGEISSYIWSPQFRLSCFNCPTPVATPMSSTEYNVNLETVHGCRGSGSITVNVVCNNLNYFVPNTFSPNNDGRNDRFFPRGSGLFTIKSLLVFNRWGQVVYEKRNFNANDPAAGWDGTFKGQPASPDVYIYMMEIVCENNVVIPVKGNVTLIR